jgi:hypothetical protein
MKRERSRRVRLERRTLRRIEQAVCWGEKVELGAVAQGDLGEVDLYGCGVVEIVRENV